MSNSVLSGGPVFMETIIRYSPDLSQAQVDSLRRFEVQIRKFAGGGSFYWDPVETDDVVSFYGEGEILLELHQEGSESDPILRCFIRGAELALFTPENLIDQLTIMRKPPGS
jgi:hypothetical protein